MSKMCGEFELAAGCLPMYTVDSFTTRPFTGNPAAVCLEDPSVELTDVMRQNIAAEMNISETAFVKLLQPGETFANAGRFSLRWMTPTSEVPLCGHGTLAASAVLFHCIKNANKKLTFETLSGELTAELVGEKIALDLPLNTPQPCQTQMLDDVKDIIQLVLPNPDANLREVQYSTTTGKLLLRLNDSYDRNFLEALAPQTEKFVSAHNSGAIKGVIVTLCGAAQGQYDFISRYFAPWVGIPEDPVTGAAHTVLAGYWSKQLGKKTLFARQCSARGGELHLTVRDDGRLTVAGPATLVLAGHIRVM